LNLQAIASSLFGAMGCDGLWMFDAVAFARRVKIEPLSSEPRIPKSSKHDLKKWSKDRPGPERSRSDARGTNRCCVGPFWRISNRKRRACLRTPGVSTCRGRGSHLNGFPLARHYMPNRPAVSRRPRCRFQPGLWDPKMGVGPAGCVGRNVRRADLSAAVLVTFPPGVLQVSFATVGGRVSSRRQLAGLRQRR
jgi:hypothetical protein